MTKQKISDFISKTTQAEAAQTTLSLLFLISSVIISITTMLAVLSLSFLTSISSYQAAAKVQFAAQSGIEDAVLRIVRNVDFSNAGNPYLLQVNDVSVSVAVTQNASPADEDTIISLAQYGSYQKKIQAVVYIDPQTDRVSIISSQNLSF